MCRSLDIHDIFYEFEKREVQKGLNSGHTYIILLQMYGSIDTEMSCRERNLSRERGEIGLALHNLLRPYRVYLAREEHKRTQRHASRCPAGDFLLRHLSEVEQVWTQKDA